MLANDGNRVDEHHPICHSFLTDGKWEYLNDCTARHGGPDSRRTRSWIPT